jgi:AmmeMemoRadiSam system protein B
MDFESGETGMVREPMVEGIFYPAEPEELTAAVRQLLSQSQALPQKVHAIVSPHASYEFSGQLMADAFKTAAGQSPDRVVIIAPCFHCRENAIYLPESPVFRSPIGESRVDMEVIESLLETSTLIQKNDLPHLQEHAIEVQLPFIQYLFPQAAIVPVLMGSTHEAVFRALVAGLTLCFGEGCADLVVVSANLTGVLDQSRAVREAARTIDLVTSGNYSALFEQSGFPESSNENYGPLAVAAWLALEYDAQVIARSNSLTVHYDSTNVVEYGALAF